MKTALIGLAFLSFAQPALAQDTVTMPREDFTRLVVRAGEGCMTRAYSELFAIAGQNAGLQFQDVMGVAFAEFPDVTDIDGDETTLRRTATLLLVALPSNINRLFQLDSTVSSPIADLIECRDGVRAITAENLARPSP